MLYEIMKHIRNFFLTDEREDGHFKIENGNIALSFLKENQYFLVNGSTFNDGVHQYGHMELIDEEFDGSIVALAIPSGFLGLVAEIEDFQKTSKPSDLASESFGGYSYTKATTSTGKAGGWQSAFGSRLNEWRKI